MSGVDVEIKDRLNDQTVICRVRWVESSTEMIVFVCVSARTEDLCAPAADHDIASVEPTNITDQVRLSAISEARHLALLFAGFCGCFPAG